MTDTTDTSTVRRLPILPLRDVVVYPHTVLPLFVGRERSVAALDQAMAGNREILLVAHTQPDIDEPGPKDIYEIGTLATILQLLKLPDGTVKVLVEGIRRAVDAVASGALDPSELYTHRYPLERLDEALDATRDRPDGFLKALVTYA